METNKPVQKFKAGAVSVSVFKNIGKTVDGAVEFFSIQIQRSYTDKAGQWQNSHSLKVNDLPNAILLLQKAYESLSLKRQQPIEQKEEFI